MSDYDAIVRMIALEAIDRANWAAHHERQANVRDMMADNFPPGDPSIQSCRDLADHHRALAREYRGEK